MKRVREGIILKRGKKILPSALNSYKQKGIVKGMEIGRECGVLKEEKFGRCGRERQRCGRGRECGSFLGKSEREGERYEGKGSDCEEEREI